MLDFNWIIDRISFLREKRGWNEYQLSVKANIASGTVYDWKLRKSKPTIESIEACCEAFGITLSQFFAKDLDEEHKSMISELINVCVDLPDEKLQLIILLAKSWEN